MKKQLFLIIFFVLPMISASGQKTKHLANKNWIKSQEKILNRPIKAVTYTGILFEGLHKNGRYSFVRTENDEFLFLFTLSRTWAVTEIEILEGLPIIIYLADGNEIVLKSLNDNSGAGTLSSYYDISREQIEKISSSYHNYVKFYFASANEILNAETDDIGTYLEFEVNAKRLRKWLTTSAYDILQ